MEVVDGLLGLLVGVVVLVGLVGLWCLWSVGPWPVLAGCRTTVPGFVCGFRHRRCLRRQGVALWRLRVPPGSIVRSYVVHGNHVSCLRVWVVVLVDVWKGCRWLLPNLLLSVGRRIGGLLPQ